jgi:cyanate lyase
MLALVTPFSTRSVIMKREQVVEAIVATKIERGLSWEAIAAELELGTVWVTSACLGMNSMPEKPAKALCQLLDLPEGSQRVLMSYPTKSWDQAVPQDPLIYRLYEVVGVYGDTLKEVIQEQFGDGIMSAIDFSMDVDKQEDPKGDRVVITMNGKFLPYKTW